jgi:hypothetical protein
MSFDVTFAATPLERTSPLQQALLHVSHQDVPTKVGMNMN